MTSKRFLSNKKTMQQTISISSSLKEWIGRYVSIMHKKNPDNRNYDSTSAFYCSVMENMLKIFESGKTLDNFEKLQDRSLKKLLNEDAQVDLPLLDQFVKMDSFMPLGYFFDKPIKSFLFKWINLFFKRIDPNSTEGIQSIFIMIRNRAVENHIVEERKWMLFPKKDNKGFDGLFESTSNYEFIHLNNLKINIAFLALLGIKITDFQYLREKKYARTRFTTTDLYFNPNDALNERFTLAKENIDHLTNLSRVIEYGTPHLWQGLSNSNHAIISFRNKDDFDKYLTKLESDLMEFGFKKDFNLNLLRFFEQIHWIKIIDKSELSFQFLISKDNHKNERELLLSYVSKSFTVLEKNQIFSLQSKVS